jgi:type-F conjugative transfer system pilin assembly protein TrbC
MQKAKEAAKSMVKPQNVYQKEGEQQAQAVDDFYNSPGFQKKVADFMEKLQKDLAPAGVNVKEYYKDAAKDAAGVKLSSSERLYIFISTSVPVSTLREYVKDAVVLGARNIVFVLRGGVGGLTALGPTAKFKYQCVSDDPSCDLSSGKCKVHNVAFQIDPFLFRKYAIESVPAIVYVPAIAVADRNVSEGRDGNVKEGDFYTVYGDASLGFVLEQIEKATNSSHVKDLVKALRKDFFAN